MRDVWLWISQEDLTITEPAQLQDEQKQVPDVLVQQMQALAARGNDYLITTQGQAEAGALLDATVALPSPIESDEPSDLEGIRAVRPAAVELPAFTADAAALRNKVYGAWLGRAYGCYHGKPVEGLRRMPGDTFILESFLKKTGQWPIQGYFSLDYPEDMLKSYNLGVKWKAGPPHMPEDDDTNYTTVGLALMEQKGADFTPEDMARFWMSNLPILHTCTAERVAYRNFCMNVDPPASGSYRNPYREWIGAQIRADFFGYAAPGNPEKAAEYAWRDACISHIKNGIYGEMWVAAMLAAAYVTSDIETIIRAGLAQIPANCRLTKAIEQVFQWKAEGKSFEEATIAIHELWNEHSAHHWCHTISNAQICAIGLLWGEGDYGLSITRAVLPGLDTDCNGATVGSIMGMVLGGAALPQDLVGRLCDRIQTGVHGYIDCSIKEMSEQMAKVIEKL